MRLLLVAIFGILLLPVFASAQTSADTVAQAQALLNQVMLLQQQLGGSGAGASAACPQIGVTLKPGSSGADVTRLQQYLATDPSIYPEGLVTGYYGALTQAAVGRWQARNGIVTSGTPATTGFGVFGPKTAAAVALQCTGMPTGGSTDTVGGFIKVSPLSGPAPLQVSVEATVNSVRSCASATYTLSWGDNTASQSIFVPANSCNILSQTYTHTYQNAGTYSVKLSSGIHETTSVVTVTGAGTTGSTTSGSSSATGSGQVSIGMTANSYTPKLVTVTSGTNVTWTNNDSMNHTVSADNTSYNSGSMAPGQSFSLTFTAPGEYTYFCAYHGGPNGVGMSGKIIVK